MKTVAIRAACVTAVLAVAVVSVMNGPLSVSAQPSSAEQLDAALEQLVKLNPEEVPGGLDALKKQAKQKMSEAKELREKAKSLNQEADQLDKRLNTLTSQVEALAEILGPEVMKAMQAGMEGDEEETPKVTFAEHIRPIVESNCIRCHNDDRKRGGLSLATYDTAMEGGSSGAVIEPGSPDQSRLFLLTSGQESPQMPPSGEPLSDEELAAIREWISLGAPQDASSEVMEAKSADAGADDGPVYVAAEITDGPPPMPEQPLDAPKAKAERGVVARAVAASPQAPLLAAGGDHQVLLYNLEEKSLIGALPFPEGGVYCLRFSVNGELLLAGGGEEGYSGKAVLWEVRTGKRIGEFGQGYDTVLAADISPDHRMVALGWPNQKVKVYDAGTGDELYEMDDHTDWVLSVRFSPDGELLATGDRAGGLHLWQAANGRHVVRLDGHEGAVHDLAYTLGSELLASAGGDGTVQLWDTWEYNRVRRFDAHSGEVLSVDFSKDGHIVTTGSDSQVFLWDAQGKKVATYKQMPDWGYQARFGADGGMVLAGSWTGAIPAWDRESGEEVAQFSTAAGAS